MTFPPQKNRLTASATGKPLNISAIQKVAAEHTDVIFPRPGDASIGHFRNTLILTWLRDLGEQMPNHQITNKDTDVFVYLIDTNPLLLWKTILSIITLILRAGPFRSDEFMPCTQDRYYGAKPALSSL